MHQFQICVARYQGSRYVKEFSCWDQFLCLLFAQLTYRCSLRDIGACLRAPQSKLYHRGFRGQVSWNALAHANEVRDWPRLPRLCPDVDWLSLLSPLLPLGGVGSGIGIEPGLIGLEGRPIDESRMVLRDEDRPLFEGEDDASVS